MSGSAVLRSGVVGRGQSRVSPVQGHQAGQGLERQRPVLVQPGGEKASVCVCVCPHPTAGYSCLVDSIAKIELDSSWGSNSGGTKGNGC